MLKRKILIVEDDLNWLKLFKLLIGDNTKDLFEYNHVLDLTTALEILKKDNDYDLILLDLMLPDSQAFNTIETMTKEVKCIPIVVISTLDDEKLITEAYKSGVEEYLIKDQYDLQTFISVVQRAIRRFIQKVSFNKDLNNILSKLQSFESLLGTIT